jgi:hypothetical protein
VQTGNFADFANVRISAEGEGHGADLHAVLTIPPVYVKDRWTGLAPVEGAVQWDGMPQ